jgi:secreted PhoX family phosphatase
MTTHADSAETGISRRSFIGGGAAATLGIALAGSLAPAAGADEAGQANSNGAKSDFDGYGPLQDDPDGRLALPNGFHYTVVAESGVTLLESGEPTPNLTDGSASFVRPGGDGALLVTNHEVAIIPGPLFVGGVPHLEGLIYDPGVHGGTTTIEVDGQGNRVREYVSLAGTSTNCAGGKTPWNTWLTCEEVFTSPAPTNTLTKPHGFVFEVDPYDMDANRDPQPIQALGRFPHEAVAVDPDTGRIYETEDATSPHGLFYRWTPPAAALPLRNGSLRALAPDAGVLEAMRARTLSGAVVADLCVATEPGTIYTVEWVAVTTRVPVASDVASQVRRQFNLVPSATDPARDITRSRKLEGAWWADGGVYFVASYARTADGSAVQHDGQVWFHDPLAGTITLRLRFAYTPANQDRDEDGPDNITVSPYGGVILAEDGEGQQHLIGSTVDGQTYFLARNDVGDGRAEMTGPNFSPDKRTLFVNLYNPGTVYAITGPWARHGGGGLPGTC